MMNDINIIFNKANYLEGYNDYRKHNIHKIFTLKRGLNHVAET